MSALGDRAAIQVALECAARISCAWATPEVGGCTLGHTPLQQVLLDADDILAWMDSRAKARAKLDPIRTPNYVLPEEFTRA